MGSTDVISPAFQSFWDAYPRRKNRIAAIDAFRWALQHDKDVAEKIQAALVWQRAEQPEAQWWPEAHRWLLGKRWEDEPMLVVIVPTAAERSAFAQWCVSLGPHAKGVKLDDWVARQRGRTAR